MARGTQAGRQPWWATALTATLLAVGFRRRPQRSPENDSTQKKVDRGWREVMRILYGHVSEHRLTAIAAGVTYFALLACFRSSARSSPSTDCSAIPPRSVHTWINWLLFSPEVPSKLSGTS